MIQLCLEATNSKFNDAFKDFENNELEKTNTDSQKLKSQAQDKQQNQIQKTKYYLRAKLSRNNNRKGQNSIRQKIKLNQTTRISPEEKITCLYWDLLASRPKPKRKILEITFFRK